MLETYVRERLKTRDILLMTHVVLGYPSVERCREMVASMVDAGVDLIELQIPFSEPIADGPVILRANQRSLDAGMTVDACLKFAEEACQAHKIPFLFMSYFNILFRRGVGAFVASAKAAGVKGMIVPDLPPEEGHEYLEEMSKNGLDPILIYAPSTTKLRMRYLEGHGKGFVYCVARKGVTGSKTDFSVELGGYLERCRAATALPLAVGFGVKNSSDIEFLKHKAEIAVIGSETIRIVEDQGVGAVRSFVESLRP